MKYYSLFAIAIALVFTSCEKASIDKSSVYAMPRGLENCSVYTLDGADGSRLNVVKCPHNDVSTTYGCGNTQCATSVVEVDTVGFGEYTKLRAKFDNQ